MTKKNKKSCIVILIKQVKYMKVLKRLILSYLLNLVVKPFLWILVYWLKYI